MDKDMNLKLFSLISSDDIPATKLQIKISGSLNAFTDDDVSFKRFSSLKEMFPSLGKALADSELIVIAVDPKIYVRTKTLLTRALSLDIEENPTVKKALGRAAEIPESQKLLQSQMPKGAVPFLTRDGVNSGFVISKGHQQIMYLPLDDVRLDTVLRNGVIPYLTSGETIAVREEAYAPKNATVKPSVPQKRQEAPAPEKAAQTPPALPESVGEITSKTVNILRESGSRVAVNGNQNSEYVKSFGSVSPDFFEFFTFTPHVEDKGDFNVTDYTAQMAKSAKELASADFGACISDICNTDGCSYICIAVAGESSAIVRKLYREPDEKDESFIRDAAEELIELIGEKASGESSVGIEISGEAAAEPEAEKTPGKGKKVLVSILVIILALAVAAGTFFLVKYQRDKKAAEALANTAPETTSEETTIPPEISKDTVPLSVFMRNEAVNGIDKDDLARAAEDAASAASQGDNAENANALPEYIVLNGVKTEAKKALAKIVAADVDDSYNSEAIKADAVAVYTYLKYRNTNFNVSGLNAAETVSDNILNAVSEVFGEYVVYNGQPAFTPTFKLSAGKTTSADVVFGNSFPYLKTVDSASDKNADGYKTEITLTSGELKELANKFDSSINLSGSAKDWVKVTKHDGAISTGVGYVETVNVGGKEISGYKFACELLENKIPSYCFAVSYTSSGDTFKITSYGSGFGVGMSLAGANKMAADGSTYAQILAKYYPGTNLS